MFEATPLGTAALSSVLFFDEINRDSKGFVFADGVIIVGFFLTGAQSQNVHTCATSLPHSFFMPKNIKSTYM
jgi:hypothetical protein